MVGKYYRYNVPKFHLNQKKLLFYLYILAFLGIYNFLLNLFNSVVLIEVHNSNFNKSKKNVPYKVY